MGSTHNETNPGSNTATTMSYIGDNTAVSSNTAISSNTAVGSNTVTLCIKP